MAAVLTRIEGVRQFLDEVGHLDGQDYNGEPDELDGELERTFLGLDRGEAVGRVQEAAKRE